MDILIQIAILILLAAGGFLLGYWLRQKKISASNKKAESKAEKILSEAKNKQKEIVFKAQDKALKITEEAKEEEKRRRKELNDLQKKLQKREDSFSQKLLELQEKQQKLYDKVNQVEDAKEEIKKMKEEQVEKLKKIASMTKEEAREVLFKNIESECEKDLMNRVTKLERQGDEKIEEKSRELIAGAMQRIVSSYVPEISTTDVDLPSDEMKGRIIGREGRNIKVIEQTLGVEIIVDDTPNTITISAFSPIRRQIAKRTLDSLIKDGRIQPAKIEEAVESAKKELAVEIKKSGEEALYEIGVAGLDPKLVQIIGRLKFRSSYGQNALQHSLEVAHLSALLAEELGLDVTLAKKSGLLHDLGKAVDQDVKGTHPEIGGNIGRKFNLAEDIINAIETHHDDRPKGLIAVVVKVADAISAARPGVRNDSYEKYLQRLEELEKITNSFDGVDKSYAIQAGREVRVFVNTEEMDDFASHKLAREIAKKIEEELKYPGEIKVNVIRESRSVEYAR